MIWPPPEGLGLEGALVRLESIRPSHHDPLREAAQDDRIWEWMDRRIPLEADAFGAWFETRLEASRRGEERCFVTRLLADGKLVGSSSYLTIRAPHDGLEIGWTWLNPTAWRTGANREAKLLMVGYAIETLGCMRVEFKTDTRNKRSRDALEALGATHEGTLRAHMLMPEVGGRDSAYFSITAAEWPAIRERLQAGVVSA